MTTLPLLSLVALPFLGSLLAAFNEHLTMHGAMAALRATYACMGAVTLASTLIFWQLVEPPRRYGKVDMPAE